ncbi:hypothetical protein ACFV3R_32510 [Streptomyces sp. NPDC059740]|uniref:hypothetical protein n=1 Tax=Streptomyces sp. NPDC059740 TaxID=3346926 RepID=UPI00366A4569
MPPPEVEVRATYQPVIVQIPGGRPRTGTVTGWWETPEGVSLCRLRLTGLTSAQWVVFDPDQINLLVQGGT